MVESSQLSLNELLCQIKACRICEAELPLGPNPIVRASFNARILIAGQAPVKRRALKLIKHLYLLLIKVVLD